jgi:antitoxin (DNA-binding transcriptional repressor) of toxin-antitoxin stability system
MGAPHGSLDGSDVSIAELRERLAELFDRLAEDPADPILYVTRNGRRIGAIMAAETAEDYQAMEDAYWNTRAAAARATREASGEPAVPWEQALAELEAESDTRG